MSEARTSILKKIRKEMGCGTSKAANSSKTNVVIKPMTPEERKRALEKEAEKRLYKQKEILRELSLPMIETRASCEDLLSLAEQSDLSGAYKLQLAETQERIQQDKLKADAQKRWMVKFILNNMSVANEI